MPEAPTPLPSPPLPNPPLANPLLATTVTTLDQVLATAQVGSRLPSVVAGIVRDGELVWTGGRGTTIRAAGGVGAESASPTPQTQYRIGSITKSFVAAGVVRAREDGLVDLDDPIGAHLPELSGELGRRSVGQFLGQAAGIQAETDGPWWERTPGGDWRQLAGILGDSALRHRAGVRFHYSNLGFAVLGELLGRVRDSTWHEVVAEQFLVPLGMTRTSLRPDGSAAQGFAVHPWADVVLPEPEHDAGAMAPAGQLWSSVSDLARWAGVVAGRSGVLQPASVELMREAQVVDDARGAGWSTGYGLGLQLWNTNGRRYAGHSGSMPGFVAMLRVDIATADAVLAMTNSTTGFGDLPVRLLQAFSDAEPAMPQPWRPQAVPSDVLELVGPWYWGPTPLAIRAGADATLELTGLAGRARASRFVRTHTSGGESAWRGLDNYYAGELLRPVRGGDGSVSHLDLASFRLTRTPYDPDADVPGGVHPDGWGPVPS
ncbi:MAG: serine hydrolase domain-containing protein [Janthinobacterium lividum]